MGADKAERRFAEAAEAAGAQAAGAQATGADGQSPDETEAEPRVAAMADRRQEAVVRVPDGEVTEAGESGSEAHGPLGPGIRPADFWGAGTH